MIMMMAVTVTVMVSGEGVEDGYGGARMVMQMVAMTLMIMMSMTTMILMLLMRVMRVIMASMDADIGRTPRGPAAKKCACQNGPRHPGESSPVGQ